MTQYADCPKCDKAVAIHNAQGGNGISLITYWHKDADGEWCRAELYEVSHWNTIRRTRNPA